jgi:hypothetical protein
MRIAFLVERQYAPYAKWLGTAFEHLDCAPRIGRMLRQALEAGDWQQRETVIAAAAEALADDQLKRGIPGAVQPKIAAYFTRPFRVINADEIAAGIRAAIADETLRNLPAGAIDQFSDSTPVLTRPALMQALVAATRDHAPR